MVNKMVNKEEAIREHVPDRKESHQHTSSSSSSRYRVGGGTVRERKLPNLLLLRFCWYAVASELKIILALSKQLF